MKLPSRREYKRSPPKGFTRAFVQRWIYSAQSNRSAVQTIAAMQSGYALATRLLRYSAHPLPARNDKVYKNRKPRPLVSVRGFYMLSHLFAKRKSLVFFNYSPFSAFSSLAAGASGVSSAASTAGAASPNLARV